MLQLLVAEAYKGLERHLVAEPVIAADLENLRADVALDETEHVRVRAPLHMKVFWRSLRNGYRSISVSPSGRNFCVKSNSRPRMTSRSMSQRTRFDTWTQRA